MKKIMEKLGIEEEPPVQTTPDLLPVSDQTSQATLIHIKEALHDIAKVMRNQNDELRKAAEDSADRVKDMVHWLQKIAVSVNGGQAVPKVTDTTPQPSTASSGPCGFKNTSGQSRNYNRECLKADGHEGRHAYE